MASGDDVVQLKTQGARDPLSGIGPVVSSAHLAESSVPELSEMEFAMTMAANAFHRWMGRCMAAAGEPGLSPLEVLVVHLVHHRARAKTLADICLVLNIEDTHLVTYAVKKLAERQLVSTGRKGKEKTVAITARGAAVCKRYGEIREALLARGVSQLGIDAAEISRLAALLRAISGSYDQAARAAAAL
ncbi:MAG: winged helix DNA-binding protein [Hyphomicrobiaceae bacterium]|nr:winged helix DNA-binding protein [Hyphomicrobiaceae bacterium]